MVGLVLLSSLLFSLGLIAPLQAHELRPSVVDVTVTDDRIRLELQTVIEPFVAGINQAEILDTNEAPEAERHDNLRGMEPDALRAEIENAWRELRKGFRITSGGTDVELEIVEITVPPVGNTELPRDSQLVLQGVLPPGDAPVTVGWVPDFGSLILRQGDADTGYSAFLSNGDLSAPLPRTGTATESLGTTFLRYIFSGFDHIVPKGLDHILFVLGLFFFSLRLRPLLVQVTSFTLAHTVTLALATLGIFSLPGAIVEPLIALSIVFVAVENILFGGPEARIGLRRTAVVFFFGLLHGLGFASVLEEFGLGSALVTALIGFNIGVEFGQLAVIAGALVLVGLPFGRRSWYRNGIAVPASFVIALVGAWWVVERVFL